ncbi:MAG TPA: hypothetical protein VHY91_12680 [Pirellulales bacterium]|jgi:hypothetical protein|nr:hypothetical protein [Pirellulales bacterium]
MKSKLLSFCLFAAIASPIWGADADPSPAATADKASGTPAQEDLEQKFAQALSGATLAGHYTVDGRSGAPSEDRYSISKVTKLEGEVWKFDVRIVYGQHDVTLPLPLTVKWAGDTPVITLTDLAIPGLGTYTARVLIYRGQYAGTWSAGDHGGELWGRVEKPAAGEIEKNRSEQKVDGAGKKSDKKDN